MIGWSILLSEILDPPLEILVVFDEYSSVVHFGILIYNKKAFQ